MIQELRRTALTSLALAILVTACETTEVIIEPVPMVELQTQPLPDDVAQVLYSGIPDRRRLYIKDLAAWTSLWNEVTANVSPRPPLPFIDFGKEAVIVAAMGTRSTGGFSIEIAAVGESTTDGKLRVEVLEVSPGPTCFVTAALTAPVHAVRAPLRNVEVVFLERSEIQNC